MYTKYHESLRLMDICIKAKISSYVHIEKEWDELFDYIHENFVEPETAKSHSGDVATDVKHPEVDLVRDILRNYNGQEMEELIRAIPPKLLDTVWPVGVARFLLRECNLPLNCRKSTTFSEFHRRYGTMILSS